MSSQSGVGGTSVSISALLKKTEHYDKDERYMATSDLCEVLKRHSAGDTNSSSTSQGGSNNSSGSGGVTMDSNTERRICTAVLRLLHDKSNDVQAIAVKTLGVLLTTVKQEQVLEIADSLADQVLDASKSELRDVYAIGLRTLVKTVPLSMGNRVSQQLVGRLLDGIQNSANKDIILACLDILTDLLGRFGATALSVTRQHEPILQMCLTQLSKSEFDVVRKRAGNTIGCLSVVLSDQLLMRMVEALLNQIDVVATSSSSLPNADTTVGDTGGLIRTMCTVSGAVGHRLGQAQIDRILPIFLRFTSPEDAITGDDDEYHDRMDSSHEEAYETQMLKTTELRESCFMGFESFILRCPTEVDPHLDNIIQAALAYMSYDPNYSYGTSDYDDPNEGGGDADENGDDDDEGMDYDDDYEDDDFGEEEDFEDDDDDESWKVRRSAIRTLKAVVEAKKHDPSTLWKKSYNVRKGQTAIVASALVSRVKEREENCRVGVIDCFTRLLDYTVIAANAGVVTFTSAPSTDDEMKVDNSATAIDLRTTYAPRIVTACQKLLSVKKGGDRSKSAALTLLSTLCKAPGGVGNQQEVSSVFKHVQSFLTSNNDLTTLQRGIEGTSKALRLDALSLVHAMLACNNHDPKHIQVGLQQTLLPQLCNAVKEQWYKVIAEALRALAAVPHFFTESGSEKEQRDQVAALLYEAIEPLLAAHDVDQEIKECALRANASLLAILHSNLSTDQRGRLLALLLERLKNETTRISAIKTLSKIAAASSASNTTTDSSSMEIENSNSIDLSPILSDSISTMASFLKLQSRSLKQNSLEAIDIIVTCHGPLENERYSEMANGQLYSMVLQELAPLIVDTDLHLSHLSLRASISLLKECPACGPAAKTHVLPNALMLSTSSLLQDLALDSLLALLQQMILSNAIDFPDMLAMLRQQSTTMLGDNQEKTIGKHSIYNLAKCIAVIAAATTPENRQGVINETLKLLEGSNTPDTNNKALLRETQLSILVMGDLGRMIDLSAVDNNDGMIAKQLQDIFMGYFESTSEDLKHAAAYSLGRASVGSQSVFLPAIVKTLDEKNQKKQYLLLSALREFIQCAQSSQSQQSQKNVDIIKDSLPVILPHLVSHCRDNEEGVRTMVAECLGSLSCLQPEIMLPKLAELVNEHSTINVVEGGYVVAADDTKSKENALVCWTIATCIKLAIAIKIDANQLAKYMPEFCKLLQQKELTVRNASLLMIYSAVHHMPQVVTTSTAGSNSNLMRQIITPALYEVAELKLERKVDLGPFTHTVDDALPLRKATLSIFATCLENLPGSFIDIANFMPVLAKALGDVEDIQLHAHHIVISMCMRTDSATDTTASTAATAAVADTSAGDTADNATESDSTAPAPTSTSYHNYLISAVDSFIAPLEKTINKKQGQRSGTELERLNDWIKSALRTMLALSRLDGGIILSTSRNFHDFFERTRTNTKFHSILETLEEER